MLLLFPLVANLFSRVEPFIQFCTIENIMGNICMKSINFLSVVSTKDVIEVNGWQMPDAG